jgi:hypothetical protein
MGGSVAAFGVVNDHLQHWFLNLIINFILQSRIRKALENRTNMEDDRVAILEAQLAQAKLIAEEADKKYEEVAFQKIHFIFNSN